MSNGVPSPTPLKAPKCHEPEHPLHGSDIPRDDGLPSSQKSRIVRSGSIQQCSLWSSAILDLDSSRDFAISLSSGVTA